MIDVNDYLEGFVYGNNLPRERLIAEMDRIWDHLGLDNRLPLATQGDLVVQFYSHPVWVLNGLFSEADPISFSHREAIAGYLQDLSPKYIADYGGGGGVLARMIATACPEAKVEIIEPYPNVLFIEKLKEFALVSFEPELTGFYDVVVAQTVLEHVDNPVQLALDMVASTRDQGYVIFGNDFYPVIKCHLPATFYLRHTFKGLMRYAGLSFVGTVPGVKYAQVFQKVSTPDLERLWKTNARLECLGPVLNGLCKIASRVKGLLLSR